jgi:hypothetical protein
MVNTDKEYMAGLKYIAGKILDSQHIMIVIWVLVLE